MMDRRGFVAASGMGVLAALGLPDPDVVLRRARGGRVGRGEVAAVRRVTKSLGDVAAEHGGGQARRLAVRFLDDRVAPWLSDVRSTAVACELFTAASQLSHLVGWMEQDEGDHEAAGLHYAHSFHLAAEAGDAESAATARCVG
ncbi:hypothetical protein [Kitasatospora sp. NPDC101183]|uniref:hypothetical protein n=1 Tax=Kitasatospora sp. NPDC101183 TaxID=3364100 RepID=UPI00381EDE98